VNRDPDTAAAAYDDNRVIKGCVESAQLLSGALRIRARDPASELTLSPSDRESLYRPYNMDNAITYWAAESRTHLERVYQITRALSEEYMRRWDSEDDHQSFRSAFEWWSLIEQVPDHGWTEPPFYGPDEWYDGNLIESYRRYYAYDKGEDAVYVRTDVPDWWPDDAPQPEVEA